jgi:hypothetical protein
MTSSMAKTKHKALAEKEKRRQKRIKSWKSPIMRKMT